MKPVGLLLREDLGSQTPLLTSTVWCPQPWEMQRRLPGQAVGPGTAELLTHRLGEPFLLADAQGPVLRNGSELTPTWLQPGQPPRARGLRQQCPLLVPLACSPLSAPPCRSLGEGLLS